MRASTARFLSRSVGITRTSFCRNKSPEASTRYSNTSDSPTPARKVPVQLMNVGTRLVLSSTSAGAFLASLRRPQVVYGRRRAAETHHAGKKFLRLLSELGQVLRAFFHPRQRGVAELDESNRNSGDQKRQHDRRGKSRGNMAFGRPANKRFKSHSAHACQKNRQDERAAEVKGRRPRRAQSKQFALVAPWTLALDRTARELCRRGQRAPGRRRFARQAAVRRSPLIWQVSIHSRWDRSAEAWLQPAQTLPNKTRMTRTTRTTPSPPLG